MSWRKSWPKLNIYGKTGDGKCAKRFLSPDERSVWDDYLDLAQISPVRSKVCIADCIGYETSQLSRILNTPEEIIVRAEKHMIKLEMICININRVITINNWKKYQSEYSRQLQYRVTGKVTSKSNNKSQPVDTERDTDKERDTERAIEEKAFLDFSYLEPQNIKNLLKAMGGDKEALKRHLKGMHFFEARIMEALEKSGICKKI